MLEALALVAGERVLDIGSGPGLLARDMAAAAGAEGRVRGGERSLDVSADLTELARTPAAVVCAGAKAALGLARTLGVLETWYESRGGRRGSLKPNAVLRVAASPPPRAGA